MNIALRLHNLEFKNGKLTLKEKIKFKILVALDFLSNNTVKRIRYIKDGIVNLFVYAPVIFQTREWDHTFLTQLIIFKLKRMRDYHKISRIIVEKERKAIISSMGKALKLLERIDNDNYLKLVKNKKDFARAHKDAEQTRQNDIDELYLILKDNYSSWWD